MHTSRAPDLGRASRSNLIEGTSQFTPGPGRYQTISTFDQDIELEKGQDFGRNGARGGVDQKLTILNNGNSAEYNTIEIMMAARRKNQEKRCIPEADWPLVNL